MSYLTFVHRGLDHLLLYFHCDHLTYQQHVNVIMGITIKQTFYETYLLPWQHEVLNNASFGTQSGPTTFEKSGENCTMKISDI